MKKVEGEDCYEGTFKIGYRSQEEFQIVRDADAKQAIYPCLQRCQKTGVPLQGPNADGKGKNWLVRGRQHEVVTVRVSLADAKCQVTVTSVSIGEKTWRSWEDWAVQTTQTFYLKGGFNQNRSTPMLPDETTPGVHNCRVTLGSDGTAGLH
eukprot:UN1960